jgi:hypothetical protein
MCLVSGRPAAQAPLALGVRLRHAFCIITPFMNTRAAVALSVLVALSLGVAVSACSRGKPAPSIVIRYAEPQARGDGPLALASCLVTVENEGGTVLASKRLPASKTGGEVRNVTLFMTAAQIAEAKRVLATCTDVAGRTGGPALHSLAEQPAGSRYTRTPVPSHASAR